MSDTVFQALSYGLLLVLPLSALAARRVAPAVVVRYAAAWFAIFGVGLLLVSALFNRP